MKKYLITTTALILVISQYGQASEQDPIIVTATRTAQTVDQSLAAVTVINQADIRRQQSKSMQDVLRGLPGISIANTGGPGKVSSVFLRGAESDQVLVLINGVKVGSATVGTAAFQDIPIEEIERIEIVRGPRSSLYGSEAIGGVIQIFTRKGSGEVKPFFSVGGGSYDTYNASVGFTSGGERGWFNLSFSGIDTEGFNACNGQPFPDGAGCFTIEPDKDGYNNLSGSLRVGYEFENGVELDAHGLRTTSETEFDGDFVNESEQMQQVFGGSVRLSPTDIWSMILNAGRSQDESDNFKDGTFQSRFNTETNSASWQNDFNFSNQHLVTLGLDYQDDKIDSTVDYAVTSRDNSGLFGQYQGTFSAHDIQFSLRQDDNEQFGKNTTGGVAWGYALPSDLRVTLSYGTAFKAPTFNELYFPDFSNPNLDPEESDSIELGISGKTSDWGRWSVHTYATDIDQLIAFDSVTFAPANIDKARIRGIEFVLTGQVKAWNLNANLTLLDPKNRSSGANDGNILPRRSEESLRFDIDRAFNAFSVGATLVAEGERFDDLANTRKLDGYTTVDLRAEYAFKQHWRLQARVVNLFDEDYETAAFFNQPGSSFFVTLRYQQ